MCSEVAAVWADGVDFSDVFGDSQQVGHRPEGDTAIVHVQAGYNDPNAAHGELLAGIGQRHIEKLGFVNTDDFQVVRHGEQFGGMINGYGQDGVGIMRHYTGVVVTSIEPGFEDINALVGNFGSF